MSDLRFIELDARGMDYVREKLSQRSSLCQSFLHKGMNEGIWRVNALVPSTATQDRAHGLREGGLLPRLLGSRRRVVGPDGSSCIMERKPTLEERAAGLIHERIQKNAGYLAIFGHRLANPGDAKLRSLGFPLRVVTHGEEVYILVYGGSERSIVADALRTTADWPSIVFLAQISGGSEILGDVLSADQVSLLARATETVIVGAYDGESYVFLEKKAQKRTDQE